MTEPTTTAAPVRARLMQRLRGLRVIHLAPVFALLALSAWALASPVGSSPDDDFHLASIWCANDTRTDLCGAGDEATERAVPEGLVKAGCYVRELDESAECQTTGSVSLDADDTISTARGNFNREYPPVYYGVMNAFAGTDLYSAALAMRLITVLLFVGLGTALFALLPLARRPAFTWGWLASTVPLGLFIIPSNNPSSWAVIGVGLGWLALLGWYETEGRRKVGLGAVFVVATVMAAGSRSDAAIYAVIGMLVVLVLKLRLERRFALNSILPAVMFIVCVISVLSSTQTNAAIDGFSDSAVVTGGAVAAAPDTLGLLAFNLLNLPSLWAGAFGTWALGWFDAPVPAVVAYGSLGVFISLAFVGFGSLSLRKALALAGVGFVLIALPLYVLTAGGDPVGVEVQPRYLLPGIVLFAGVLALSAGSRLVRLTRGQAILVLGTLAIIQFISLHSVLRRYVTGQDVQGWNIDAGAEWWWSIPFSPMTVLVIGSLAYAGLCVLLARASRPVALPAVDGGAR